MEVFIARCPERHVEQPVRPDDEAVRGKDGKCHMLPPVGPCVSKAAEASCAHHGKKRPEEEKAEVDHQRVIPYLPRRVDEGDEGEEEGNEHQPGWHLRQLGIGDEMRIGLLRLMGQRRARESAGQPALAKECTTYLPVGGRTEALATTGSVGGGGGLERDRVGEAVGVRAGLPPSPAWLLVGRAEHFAKEGEIEAIVRAVTGNALADASGGWSGVDGGGGDGGAVDADWEEERVLGGVAEPVIGIGRGGVGDAHRAG
mmetsp:Transcript_57734/g.114641  ORF Transcript_57734/g.114641 Transcript_57734/m.114641 type:complete len:257 (+) Transcript_57734:686-1456(+)